MLHNSFLCKYHNLFIQITMNQLIYCSCLWQCQGECPWRKTSSCADVIFPGGRCCGTEWTGREIECIYNSVDLASSLGHNHPKGYHSPDFPSELSSSPLILSSFVNVLCTKGFWLIQIFC